MQLVRTLREKNLAQWLGGYCAHRATRWLRPRAGGRRHLLFALCDHFEPLGGGASEEQANERVRQWHVRYPELAGAYRDADGVRPQHTFFFPAEEYRAEFFHYLDDLVARRLGEVEVHLHHDGATESSLREEVERYLSILIGRGHLGRTRGGEARFGFIHGNWALANARPDGRYCGVDAELDVLFRLGCYADFTFPAVPDASQPPIVNRIYWPEGDTRRRRAQDRAIPARVGRSHSDRLLIIQGPLGVGFREGRWGAPRLEYGALTAADPPTLARVQRWVRQGIVVEGRPEWVFVKVHTHGAGEDQAQTLLGAGGQALHQALQDHFNDGNHWCLHYVTAREMYNIAKAAMTGKTGDPGLYRDFELSRPPLATRRSTVMQGPALALGTAP